MKHLLLKYGHLLRPLEEDLTPINNGLVALMLESRPALQGPFLRGELRYDDVLDLVEAAGRLG